MPNAINRSVTWTFVHFGKFVEAGFSGHKAKDTHRNAYSARQTCLVEFDIDGGRW